MSDFTKVNNDLNDLLTFDDIGIVVNDKLIKSISTEINTNDLKAHFKINGGAFIGWVNSLTVPAEELLPVPDFHITEFNTLIDPTILRYSCAMPRGFSKTTVVKTGLIHIILYTEQPLNIGYISNSEKFASRAIYDIRTFLMSSEVEKVYGKFLFLVDQQDRGYYKIKTPNGHIININSYGANSQIRGSNFDNRRLDIIVVDDLENRQDNKSDVLYAKIKQWFFTDALKALTPVGRCFMIGNIVAEHSILEENTVSPKWASTKLSAIKKDGTALWPERYSLHYLVEDYKDYCSRGLGGEWVAEMLNDPSAHGAINVDMSKIQYSDKTLPEDYNCTFITVDPAYSAESWGHQQAIVVHGLVETALEDYWVIVDYQLAVGDGTIELYNKVTKLADKWNAPMVGIESEAYQGTIKGTFEYLDKVNGREGMIEWVKLYTNKRSKTSRIISFLDSLYKGLYRLVKKDTLTTAQLINYNPESKNNSDDLIDCEAYGLQILDKFYDKLRELNARKIRVSTDRLQQEQSARLRLARGINNSLGVH